MTMGNIVFLVIFLTMAQSAFCGESKWIDFRHEQPTYIEKLSDSVFYCVNRMDTRHPVFHGCVDWHSSVHGYWALLRASKYIENTQKKTKYLNFVMNSFSSQSLNEERSYLKDNKEFEMPYGRAWFLRLAVEYEAITRLMTLRQMADDVALSLLEYYTSHSPIPNLAEYENAEWVFRNLHDYAKLTNNGKILAFVHSNAKTFLNAGSLLPITDDRWEAEFFSRWGNYFHLLEILVDSRTFNQTLNKFKPNAESMVPIKLFKSDHHLAINYSRAWGLWSAYKITNNKVYRDAYLENVMAGYALHEAYKNNYHSYGHWVPQFGIYSITYSLEH